MALVNVPLGQSDWRRDYSRAPYLRVRNRFLEINPANGVEQVSFLTRPALKRWANVGDGPNRGLFSEPGSFSGALFVMSGRDLYRVSTTGAVTLIGNGFFKDDDQKTRASMAATAAIGSTPEKLFIADGKQLKVYQNETFARGELFASGTIDSNDQIEIGGIYYRWVNGSVDGSSPAGTLSNPWKVARTLDDRQNLENMRAAINGTGVPGTTYSTALVANTLAEATASGADFLILTAKVSGVVGNTITTSVTTGANIAWGGATLTGGFDEGLSIVDVPDGLAPISAAFIAGYIIVVPEPVKGFIGRFYWIEPGETEILPLNFATAERSPDPIVSVRSFGDQFALFGVTTTEMWFPTGDLLAPFARSQGRVFDRGIWVGSDVSIKDTLVLMDTDGVVYRIDGGGPQRISDNSAEERTRKAIKTATSPTAPPAEGSPGPLAVTLSTGVSELSADNTFGQFAPVAATISGGIAPYTIQFSFLNEVNGVFSFLGASNQSFAVPEVAGVENSTTATAFLVCSVTDAAATTEVSGPAEFRFTNTLPVGAPPPAPLPSLTVSVAPTSSTGRGTNQTGFNFGTFTASHDGVAPFTYQWFFQSTDFGSFSFSAPTSQATQAFVSGVIEATSASAVLRCRVIDANGAEGTSPEVNLFYTNAPPRGGSFFA
jgi:hypothetical protein